MARKPKETLRIAMLGHKRIPSREGGVEIVVSELATRMCKLGHSVTCYNRKGHHIGGADFDETALKEYNGVRLKQVLTIDKKGLAAMTSSFFAALRAAFGKYDVVHFHAEGPCAMMWLPKLFGKKCIATIHGLDHQREKWGKFASWYIFRGEKCAVKRADEIIVLSENVKNYFKEQYGRKTVFVPNGVNRPQRLEAQEITETFGLKKEDYILFLGRLVPEKGIHYLVEAYGKLDTDKKLVIAGGSSDTSEYEQQLKRLAGENPNVIFTGFIQGQILEELYSNAYIYVLPSDLEGMPLSLLEAMSYGNCCVTSNIPECANVMLQYGITFEKGNVQALAETLQVLCDNAWQVATYKKRAADYICQTFNWDDVTAKTLSLYGAAGSQKSLVAESQKEPVKVK